MEKFVSFTFHLCLFTEEKYNVDRISDQLKIYPTKKWVKDELNPKPRYRDASGWVKSSSEIFGFEFAAPFLDFFKEFKDRLSSLQQLMTEDKLFCKIDVVVRIYNGGTMPGIYIDSEMMAHLSMINCSLDFDMYDLRKNKAH